MNILITGANGFIGRHIVEQALEAGYQVYCGVRVIPQKPDARVQYILMDFTEDVAPENWIARLDNIDVVINAVGIFQQRGSQSYQTIHTLSPQALFEASRQTNVQRVIQISALGADDHAQSHFHRSKKAADDYLRAIDIEAFIIQPSLVFGLEGASTRLFLTLASMPVLCLPNGGRYPIQPVHISDLARLTIDLITAPSQPLTTIPVVGPTPLLLAEYLGLLRKQLGLGKISIFTFPASLLKPIVRLMERLPNNQLSQESIQMLERGNTAEHDIMHHYLTADAKPVEDFISPEQAKLLKPTVILNWLLPLVKFSIAFVWIFTGFISLGIYPTEESYKLLSSVGIPASLGPLFLYGSALLDIALGIAIFLLPKRSWVWVIQLCLIAFYTLVISWKMPEFWIHPYGPLTKNIPMMAAIFLILMLEDRNGISHR
ncbi:SDR family oxidoreductase [Methylophaga pinxianii]|uniref:SDR family oxidoreductase n=1 Tax=Methylophaga pinxianii TaxID=2881052 RepID=UPI001CF2B460|nr:SDR family oxidoreductase [Methylophaga pinxianii]MCB2426574.1 SDR family oxidoreductase [Methylophaga pinxianii]UPH44863.1 SDR family oxidoreductase [Methylophaga pinxianii]